MALAHMDRHWLVLAVATLWGLAYGTRVEEARLRGRASDRRTYWPAPALSGAVQWKISAAATAASASPPRARFPNPFANTTN